MSHVTLIRLESLSNEVLLHILEYLDAYMLYFAFYGLNRRFDELLRSCHLHVLFDESKHDPIVWNTLASSIVYFQIYHLSFHSNTIGIINKQILRATGQTLSSLSLQGTDKALIDLVIRQLASSNQVKRLTIDIGSTSGFSFPSLVNFVFCKYAHYFISLVDCSLRLRHVSGEFHRITAIFSHLHRFSISRCLWTSNTVLFLQDNTPNLRSLRIWPQAELLSTSMSSNYKLNHIRELEIIYNSKSPNMAFMLASFPALRRLRIEWRDLQWISILSGGEWQKIIETHLPDLQQMTIDFCAVHTSAIDEQIVRTFQRSEFWSRRRVIIKMTTENHESRHQRIETIYFGKRWHF
ncbi:unnamed protein product [Rotaria sp. Silwood2]|nr:unnamed protein product [Rotaria sp. Silwood2]CAF3228793.1 unnamed protein product [Rotaria sp. Silwood2]CAF4035865.1 unnamed protein product [Rotaria sp. Silwood2]CAF4282642.1 unnamed protein product [Rotaria sp. Silwood2]